MFRRLFRYLSDKGRKEETERKRPKKEAKKEKAGRKRLEGKGWKEKAKGKGPRKRQKKEKIGLCDDRRDGILREVIK